jgi:hypothetical protein
MSLNPVNPHDIIQTYRISSDRVGGAPYCFITGVDLYFKNKPPVALNISGIVAPGVTVELCRTSNDQQPIPDSVLTDAIKRLSYSEIPLYTMEETSSTITSSTSGSTTKSPILKTQSAYTRGTEVLNFNFAEINSPTTLYFSTGSGGALIALYRNAYYGTAGSTNFFHTKNGLIPGLQKLTATDRAFLQGKMDPRGGSLTTDYYFKDNNIFGAGKIVWNHDQMINPTGKYSFYIGQGKERDTSLVLTYPSAITTSTTGATRSSKKILSGSRVFGSAAKFIFDTPILVKTNTLYGIVVNFESPEYELWFNQQGDYLIGQTIRSSGATDISGKYFDYTNDEYKAINDRDLMFEVYAAKFTSNTQTVEIVNDDYEFLTINNYNLSTSGFIEGEYVYQDYGTPTINATYGFTGSGFFTRGTVNTQKGITDLTSSDTIAEEYAFNFPIYGTNTFFTQDFFIDDIIVLTDLTSGNTDVRKIRDIVNNTVMTIDTYTSFSNTVVYMKKTATGKVYTVDYGANNIILSDSNANTTVLFKNDGIYSVMITAGGSGYNNTDILRVYGGGSTLNATANVITTGAGAIVAFRFSNVGTAFTSAPSFIISNSSVLTANSSAGAGATLTADITGGVLKGEVSTAAANIVSITDFRVGVFDPEIVIENQSIDTNIDIKHNFAYLDTNYYVNSAYETSTSLSNNYITSYKGLIMSRSNEIASGTYLHNNDKSSILKATISARKSADNLYMSPVLHTDELNVFTYQYDINNDITNENTRYGNAHAKYVSRKISFKTGTFVEDIRVFVTAYKPVGTDIVIFAKIYNTNDNIDSFDDREWSLLELKNGIGLNSSQTKQSDLIDLTYGFRNYPQIEETLTGTVKIETGNTTITGSSTTFNTDLANNDLIRVYNEYFANTNYFVAVVTGVGNSTSLTINSPITNNSVLGSGLKIDKIGTKHEAFNNPQNYNMVRYYNSEMIEVDDYNVMSVKVVLLSSDDNIVPEVEDIRVIGVSA